jgi:hypothetical protein
MMPLFAIGMQNTLVKFFDIRGKRNRFLSFTVLVSFMYSFNTDRLVFFDDVQLLIQRKK